MTSNLILVFDIGGSKLVTGLVDSNGEVLWKQRLEWSPSSGREVMKILLAQGHEALAQNPALHPALIGATIPGVADPDNGIWLSASFSGIGDLAVADELSDAFGLPAFADNDGQACVLAERLFGAGRDCDDFLYLTVSNGIGGGIFSGGHLLKGAYNGAGELGHCTVEEGGRVCQCGKRGCLEAYAAGPGLSSTYRDLCGRVKTGEELAKMARAGDSKAQHVWDMEGEYLGRAIGFAVNLLNPRRVIIGGGISLAFSLFEESLEESVRKHLFHKPNGKLELMPTALGYDGGLLGAAAVALCSMRVRANGAI